MSKHAHALGLGAAFLAVAMMLSVATPSASQPHVRTGETDACYGAGDAYWVDSLMDALEDRAPFICACRTRPGPAAVSIGIDVRAPGRVGDSAPITASDTTADESSCVEHRVHSVAHAWLASTAPRLQPPAGTLAAATRVTYSHAAIPCPASGGHDAQSTFSREFMARHPGGLRAGASVPAPRCRRAVQALLEVPFSW